MDHSYVYTKRFIDTQVKKLGAPLKIDLELRLVLDEGVDEKVLQAALDKINIRIKRHTSNMFKSQVTNQIIQQVIKLEQSKVEEVRDRLVTITRVMNPLMVADQGFRGNYLKEFNDLVQELPEPKYLLLKKDDSSPDSESESESEFETFELKPKQTRRQLRQSVDEYYEETEGSKLILAKYDEIRHALVELNLSLKYKLDKLQYLQTLESELVQVLGVSVHKPKDVIYDSDEETTTTGIQENLMTSNGDLTDEINRFRILVEKIGFKLGNKDLLEISKRVNIEG